jgi:glycosyltransferase involved in cell wall biosynthesis
MKNTPLVSIGIPCYNRAHLIGRAIESALKQDYRNLELIISDNASTDETEAVCRDFAARDDRVTYIRQAENQGAVFNFDIVRRHAQGKYFLWLGDDDWLEPDYVSACVNFLEAHADYVVAYGRARFYQGDLLDSEYDGFSLSQKSGVARVIDYYRQVDDNSMFYGVFNRKILENVGNVRDIVGGDWIFMSRIAYQGKVQLLPETCVHRMMGGTSENLQKIVAAVGLHPLWARFFYLRLGYEAGRDILISPNYAGLRRMSRLKLAWRCQRCFWKRQWTLSYYPLKGRTGERIFALSKAPLSRPLYALLRGSFRIARRLAKR